MALPIGLRPGSPWNRKFVPLPLPLAIRKQQIFLDEQIAQIIVSRRGLGVSLTMTGGMTGKFFI